jgi:hypothetical protein
VGYSWTRSSRIGSVSARGRAKAPGRVQGLEPGDARARSACSVIRVMNQVIRPRLAGAVSRRDGGRPYRAIRTLPLSLLRGGDAKASPRAGSALGRVPHERRPLRGQARGFRLTLVVVAPETLRVEVVDPRGDRRPLARRTASPTDETGRGLVLIDALAARWGSEPWAPAGKVVWAELALPCPVPPVFHV